MDKRVFSYYVAYNENQLHRVKKIIENKDKIQDFNRYFELRDKVIEVDEEWSFVQHGATLYENEEHRKRLIASGTERIIKRLTSDEVIQVNEGELEVDSLFEKTLDEFIYFLRVQ